MDNFAIQSLSAQRFKNLYIPEDFRINNLNIFIGSNGSGKSNFISIMEFLKDCIVSSPDGSGFVDAIAEFGGPGILCKSVKNPSAVSLTYSFLSEEFTKGLELGLELYVYSKDSMVSIGSEYLSDSKTLNAKPFYYYKLHDNFIGSGVVSVWNDDYMINSHFETLEKVPTKSIGLVSVLDLLEQSKNSPQKTPIYKARRTLVENIKKWHFYNANNMNLETIRSSEPKIGPSDIYLSPSGHNLALLIENLIQQDINFEDQLNQALKSIMPTTRRFRPARTGLMTVNLQWFFDGADEPFYLNELSDGTVRMICWAAILLSPKLPTLLVIDEPELGIHASWMPILAEWIKRAAERTQVIVCTHSSDLLDHFTDCLDSKTSNIYCFASEDKKQFSIKRLTSDSLKDRLDEGWMLGDLYRVGDPSVGGWPW